MPRSSQPQKKIAHPHVVFSNPLSGVANSSPALSPPSLGQTLKEGLAFGTGSAIAHRIFNPFPTQVVEKEKKVEIPCDKELTAFTICLKTISSDGFCGEEQMAYTKCINDPKNN